MTTPSNNSSGTKIFEPAPSINNFSLLSNFFKKFTKLFKLSALKKTFDLPPILNQFFFLRSYSNLTFCSKSINNFLILLFPLH